MSTKPADVDSYLADLPAGSRATLETLRHVIKAAVPDAVESISYGMPTFKYWGRPLIYFAAWKNHCAVYGMNMESHREELAAYDTERGTIRFPLDKPLPEPLISALVGERKAEIEAVQGKS